MPFLYTLHSSISIHSLRMEGDKLTYLIQLDTDGFQSTPSAWRETFSSAPCAPPQAFQSTPSAWRETLDFPETFLDFFHFNPLPPHGGRPVHLDIYRSVVDISIHSLRMEGDSNSGAWKISITQFQSTPSAWRETDSACPFPGRRKFQSTPSAWRETAHL